MRDIITSEGFVVTALILTFLLLITFLILLTFTDARDFANECIKAGGYVAAPKVCIR